jgi:hypothetical protein
LLTLDKIKKVIIVSLLFSAFLSSLSVVNDIDSSNKAAERFSVPPVYAQGSDSEPVFGMNMRGYYTAMPQERDFNLNIPENYYEDSFRVISDAGIKFLRYLFFWESYERDPFSFMSELRTVANTADKWGIQVLYANDQFDTSSWLGPRTATGFPSSLFESNPSYPFGTGGGIGPKDVIAKKWWNDWLNRNVKDENGNDGWMLQADYLKKIVDVVDDHKSTLGYEILNEPHIHDASQWEKIGKYNTFMTDEMRTVTQKTIFFDRQVPSELDGELGVNPENMAKMAPSNKNNVIFKATVFGLPYDSSYAEARLHYYAKTAELAGVPLCICEFNLRSYDEFEIGEDRNVTMSQENMNLIVNKIEELNVWGMAAWLWNIKEHSNANYDFVVFTENGISTTENFDYLKNAVLDSTIGEKEKEDTISPAMFISSPKISSENSSIFIKGYSFDVGSGIKSVQVHTNDGDYVNVSPIEYNGIWNWTTTLPFITSESQRIIGKAVDNTGNIEYTTIPLNSSGQ